MTKYVYDDAAKGYVAETAEIAAARAKKKPKARNMASVFGKATAPKPKVKPATRPVKTSTAKKPAKTVRAAKKPAKVADKAPAGKRTTAQMIKEYTETKGKVKMPTKDEFHLLLRSLKTARAKKG